MGKISFLSATLQNQIAAGEVVERPASIVKELMENAVDAGATNILVEMWEGGIKKIRIVDNGCGMSEEDANMALLRYATSKLKTVDDLFSLASFGFRGEALASIASVSHLTLKTRMENTPHGFEVQNQKTAIATSCAVGTDISVENVFWNVPARRKFLKAESVESREIVKIFERFALSHPHISVQLHKDGKNFLSFSGRTDENAFENRVVEVLGTEISSHLLPLHFLGESIKISGFCSHPNFHRSTRDRQFLFVNSRMVSVDKSTAFAVNEAYDRLLPSGKFPSFVLKIDMDPDLVDVNVHPRKTEVKFLHPQEILFAIKNAFAAALSRSARSERENFSVPAHSFHSFSASSGSSPKNFSWNFSDSSSKNTGDLKKNFHQNHFPQRIQSDFFSAISDENGENGEEGKNFSEKKYRIVGQVKNAFVVVEEQNGMRIIDQHAAHERILYEKLKNDFLARKIQSQPLLAPVIFGVSVSEKMKILEEKEHLEMAGFSVDDFGGQEIAISAVPAGCEKVDIAKLFRDLLDDLDEFDKDFLKNVHQLSDRTISYTACRSAIKFGQTLSFPEMEKLVEDWNGCNTPDACAHGRPVSVFLPYKQIENDCGR